MVLRGTVVGTTEPVTVSVLQGMISELKPGPPPQAAVGGDDVWIAPGVCDLQVNGAGGVSYSSGSLTVDEVLKSREWLYRAGTALFCPTVTTSSAQDALHALRTLALACEQSETTNASCVGFHVEGPYISSDDGPRGAHPKEQVRNPDWDELSRYQEAAGGRIRILTLAPEREGALWFIERAAESGLIVSIGHTGASGEQIRDAVKAGARMSTHLGNGSHAKIDRLDNYIWEQLAADELWAGLIPDGHHLPPPVLKTFWRAKGKERVCLVSDVASIAGLPPGVYRRGGGPAAEIHPNGKISLAGTPYLAGASLFLDRGIANTVAYAGAALAEAVEAATRNPARLLGMEDRYGTVAVGREATLSLFRYEHGKEALEPVATIVRGNTVFGV